MTSYTFAIGDIHGCFDLLQALMDKIERSRPVGGKVVFLGDYIDRGAQSREVVEYLIAGPSSHKWKWVTLKGNHEAMMVSALSNSTSADHWVMNGGAQTIQSYNSDFPKGHIDWMGSLPRLHEDTHRIFVHAGVDTAIPLSDQTDRTLLWSRAAPHYSGEYWGKHLVHGHTPSPQNPQIIGNRTNVDSGAFFTGQLSCAVFEDDLPGVPVEFITVGK